MSSGDNTIQLIIGEYQSRNPSWQENAREEVNGILKDNSQPAFTKLLNDALAAFTTTQTVGINVI